MIAKCSILSYLSLILYAFSAASLECYVCDSAEDAECATRPGQHINVEECSRDDDECVTVIVAGITRRGCLSRLFPNNYCAAPCDRCNTSLCNRNIFPLDRLRCYQCTGADCIDVNGKSRLVLPCPVYNEKDRCYTNVIGISNVQRGCEHTDLPPTCPNVCLKCNYDGCNNELGVREQSCLECTHNIVSPNPNCLRSQQVFVPTAAVGDGADGICSIAIVKRCSNKLMHGHAGKCFTYINEQTGVVQRGCSTTMGFYPSGSLSECYGVDCNDKCLDISCNNCSTIGDNGFACRAGFNLRTIKCEANSFACYSCEKDLNLRRGCVDGKFQPNLRETCYQCRDADGCNRTPIRTCYRCSSLEDDLNCSNWTNETLIGRNNCTTADDVCVTTIISKLNLIFTVRGCASQVPECSENDPYCVRCNGSLCNNHRMPLQGTSINMLQSRQRNLLLQRSGGDSVHLSKLKKLLLSLFDVLHFTLIYYKFV